MYPLQQTTAHETVPFETGTQPLWKGRPSQYPFVFMYALPLVTAPAVLALARLYAGAAILPSSLAEPVYLYGAAALFALVMLAQIVRAHLTVFGASYAIHSDRLEYASAFGGQRFTLPLSSMRGVHLTRAWWQRLAGIGTVMVSGAAGQNMEMMDLRDYEEVHALLVRLSSERW